MTNEIIIKPKNMFNKKFFLIPVFIRLPYPEIEIEIKTTLTKNISNCGKNMVGYLCEFLNSSIVLSITFEKFIFDFHPY